MEKTEIPKIFQAINGVMKKMGAIGKDRKNQSQGYNFRGIDDLYNELHTHLADEGVFSIPRVVDRFEELYENKNGTRMIRVVLKVEYDFTATDGSKVTVGPIYGEGNDSADKATNKAFSACHKYAMLQLFAIPTEEEKDADAETPVIPKEAVKKQTAKPRNEAKVPIMVATAKKRGWENAQVSQLITKLTGKASSKELIDEELDLIIDFMTKNSPDTLKERDVNG